MLQNVRYLSDADSRDRTVVRLPASTHVLTPNGMRPVGALRKGGQVSGADGVLTIADHGTARGHTRWVCLPGGVLEVEATQTIAVEHPYAEIYFGAPVVRLTSRALGWRTPTAQDRFVPAVDMRFEAEGLLPVAGYFLSVPGREPASLPPLLDEDEAFWLSRKIGADQPSFSVTGQQSFSGDQSRSIAIAMP